MSTSSLDLVSAELASPPETPDERYFHDDLRGASAGALKLELERRRLGLLLVKRATQWVLERVAAIEAELRARNAD